MKKQHISILLLCAMLAALPACGQEGGALDTSTSDPLDKSQSDVTIDEYGREVIMHGIPDSLDFDGLELVSAVRADDEFSVDFGVEAINGDIVNDAVFRRNAQVEEELNVRFSTMKIAATNTTSADSVGDMLRKNVMAGDDTIDICGVYQAYGSAIAAEGMLYNLLNLKHIDLSKPWWNSMLADELTYKNQLYYSVGSMNLSVTSSLAGVFFNQAKVTDYHGDYEFLYDLVYDGEWTLDKLTQLVSDTYRDLNQNNEQDSGDFYGFIVKEDDPGPWNAAMDVRLCTKDASGTPQLSFFNERTVDIYEKLYSFYRKTNGVYFGDKSFEWRTAFANGQSLFAVCYLNATETHLRDMKDGYGILPMPKYDTAQKQYYNAYWDTSNLTGIAVNCKNPDAAGAALELLNYYGYQWVTPAYYEVAMKTKYLADTDSANMFDLITDNIIVDFGEVHTLSISGGKYTMEGFYSTKFRNLIRLKNENLASNYAQYEETYKNGLKNVLEQYDKLAK